MTVKQKDKQAPEKKESHSYSGSLSDLQLFGSSFQGRKYDKIQYDSLNDYQNFLYNRALFGLAVYSQEEIKLMRWDKRKRIVKVHRRAQLVLNVWKQQIVNAWSTVFFMTWFPKTLITQTLIETTNDTDPAFVNKMSFKSLRITKTQVVNKLIVEGILPPNFYELKNETTCK
jgi:hypothetical protein